MKPQIYILKNTHLEVHISTLGATLTRMLTKDLQGKVVDVLLGMEKAEDIYILPGTFGWDDVGSWLAVERGKI